MEAEILTIAVRLRRSDEPQFHGFQLAEELADEHRAKKLISHGTLYKALGRLQAAELLTSEWEDPDIATAAGRPRRRLYRVTAAGAEALHAWEAERATMPEVTAPLGLEPS